MNSPLIDFRTLKNMFGQEGSMELFTHKEKMKTVLAVL